MSKSPTSQVPELKDAGLISMKPADLRVGMYVDLNCSWFRHPFARKNFKLTTEQQIKTIQTLGLSAILVDPSHSDPHLFGSREQLPIIPIPPPNTPKKNVPIAAWRESGSRDAEGTSFSPNSYGTSAPSPHITQYKDSLHQTEAAYQEVLGQSQTVLASVYSGSEEGMATAKEMLNGLTDLLLNDATAGAMAILMNGQDLDDTNALHALNSCVLSMMVGRQFDLSPDELKVLGIAALLHDIGLQKVPAELLKNPQRLTQKERALIQKHPEYGADMVKQFTDFPPQALEVILHHHERVNGSGYPAALTEHQLSLLTKIVMVVDEYDALINNPSPDKNLNPSEALSYLYVHGRAEFSQDVVVAFIQTLSVYPPGTIVQLSDGSFGLVISINFKTRMRPLILLYDPLVPADNPLIVDLAKDHHRSISRRVAKQELARDVADYLNLTRWTGYFLQSSMNAVHEGSMLHSDTAEQ